MNKLVLASASIGRKRLFERDFGDFEIAVSDFDEDSIEHTDPAELVQKLAVNKARIVAGQYPGAIVCGFDTVVLFEGEVLGKPATTGEAREMLRRESGAEQVVLSGYAVICREQSFETSGVSKATLRMKPITNEFIEHYISNHPVTRYAGGYGAQDSDELIELIDGDMDVVVGAPMDIVRRIVDELRK
jgi:septum formation protein